MIKELTLREPLSLIVGNECYHYTITKIKSKNTKSDTKNLRIDCITALKRAK